MAEFEGLGEHSAVALSKGPAISERLSATHAAAENAMTTAGRFLAANNIDASAASEQIEVMDAIVGNLHDAASLGERFLNTHDTYGGHLNSALNDDKITEYRETAEGLSELKNKLQTKLASEAHMADAFEPAPYVPGSNNPGEPAGDDVFEAPAAAAAPLVSRDISGGIDPMERLNKAHEALDEIFTEIIGKYRSLDSDLERYPDLELAAGQLSSAIDDLGAALAEARNNRTGDFPEGKEAEALLNSAQMNLLMPLKGFLSL